MIRLNWIHWGVLHLLVSNRTESIRCDRECIFWDLSWVEFDGVEVVGSNCIQFGWTEFVEFDWIECIWIELNWIDSIYLRGFGLIGSKMFGVVWSAPSYLEQNGTDFGLGRQSWCLAGFGQGPGCLGQFRIKGFAPKLCFDPDRHCVSTFLIRGMSQLPVECTSHPWNAPIAGGALCRWGIRRISCVNTQCHTQTWWYQIYGNDTNCKFWDSITCITMLNNSSGNSRTKNGPRVRPTVD